MAYALSASDIRFVALEVYHAKNVMRLAFTTSMLPNHIVVTELSIGSMAVDQESQNFDMGYFNMSGPVYYVRKEDYSQSHLNLELNQTKYITTIPVEQ